MTEGGLKSEATSHSSRWELNMSKTTMQLSCTLKIREDLFGIQKYHKTMKLYLNDSLYFIKHNIKHLKKMEEALNI